MAKKVLFALTSHDQLGDTGRKTGFYVPEVAHPAEVFRTAGYEIAYVSVRGGSAPQDGITGDDTVVSAFLDDQATADALASTPTPKELSAEDFDVIYFAGGHGTMWDFPDSAELTELAAGIYERGGVVAAVCHGPAGLVNLKLSDGSYLVDGKQVASFTDDEESAVGLTDVVPFLLQSKLEERGAKFTKAPNFTEHAVADTRLVTGQNPASAAKVAQLTVAALAG
ncbi:type 1 glutamine amidotransferase domain-containing protein [Streptomyces sp. 796.1]|uniref:type 1 glutamine amidotransferase domain-containing protein n=1 Tax=Streptomyces sp. 796.1 TaxID=3163029 RepID=UPI0039C928B5